MGRVLVHLPQSPWSEKARWALDHHGVGYRAVEHMPLVFEGPLRLATRDLRRKVTVPILFDGSHLFRDSLAIAEHAEEIGTGTPLFPAAHRSAVLAWNDVAERIMFAARARVMDRLLASPSALAEQLPDALRPAGTWLLPAAKLAALWVVKKYGTRASPPAETEAIMAAGLEQAARALERGDSLVGDTFTFADIAVACSLGFIRPHERVLLGPEGRKAFSEPTIAAAFPQLLEWRDRVYEKHR